MSEEGKARSAAAGARNLAAWRAKNPAGGGLKHGAYSAHVRKRYTDGRTREGKQLRAVMASLVEDLGGMTALRAGQLLILDRVREKLVILAQMGAGLDTAKTIFVARKGGAPGVELLPFLSRGYLSFSEALRRDLELLYALSERKSSQGLDLDAYLKARKAGGDGAPASLGDGAPS